MTFSRSVLAILGVAVVAGGAYGYWQSRQELQTASVSDTFGQASIVGAWTSADDAAYRVDFAADGTLTEHYQGEAVSSGTYRFASSPGDYAEGSFDTLGPRGYLLEDVDGEQYAYRVLELTRTGLQLEYLGRGNTLSFTR